MPDVTGEKEPKKKFKSYPIGFFHIDIAEVRTEEGKIYLFVAIDRTSKFIAAKHYDRATTDSAKAFLEGLIHSVPYRIHTVLTDNGIQFAPLPKKRNGKTARYFGHPFIRVCKQNGIDHRLTKPDRPWTNGQIEPMNHALKEATVNRYYYQTHQQLSEHLDTFLAAYNFAKRPKTLHGLNPNQFILQRWAVSPNLFLSHPSHLNLALYT